MKYYLQKVFYLATNSQLTMYQPLAIMQSTPHILSHLDFISFLRKKRHSSAFRQTIDNSNLPYISNIHILMTTLQLTCSTVITNISPESLLCTITRRGTEDLKKE